jgi:hypothetical protein
VNGTNYEVPYCGAFSTPHSHPSLEFIVKLHKQKENILVEYGAQIFASGTYFQIIFKITTEYYLRSPKL